MSGNLAESCKKFFGEVVDMLKEVCQKLIGKNEEELIKLQNIETDMAIVIDVLTEIKNKQNNMM